MKKVFSYEIVPTFGHTYSLEFRRQSGELEDTNSYEILRFYPDVNSDKKNRVKLGWMNELYLYLDDKNTILSAREVGCVSEVMIAIGGKLDVNKNIS
jgi:hypothetical protein